MPNVCSSCCADPLLPLKACAAVFFVLAPITLPAQSGDDPRTVLAPEPLKAGKELAMAELPAAAGPAVFHLYAGTDGRYGPYELADGTLLGSRQAACVLRVFDSGERFTLQPTNRPDTVYGPFAATNGASVTLGNTAMTLRLVPPEVRISVSHRDRIKQLPLIGIAPYSPALSRELYALRAKYIALANRADADTADMELAGVPRITYPNARNTSSTVIRTSARDRLTAVKGTELSAIAFLEKLFGQAFSIRSQAITDGATYHFRMPPGDYLLCATQRVKDPNATAAAGSLTAVWWTPFHFDGEHPLALALTAENAITWREIFQLSRQR